MTRLANLPAHRAAASAPNVIAFPLAERIKRNEARLAWAREVLRTAEEQDAFSLRMAIAACRDLGTESDKEVAAICEAILDEDARNAIQTARDYRQIHALDRVITVPPPEQVVVSQGLQRLTIGIVAFVVAAVVLAIAHDAPARTAATVLQAQAEGF